MAISKGNTSEVREFNRYVGVAPCKIVAVNPTKKELNEVLGINTESEPEYVSETTVNDKTVKQARITFWVKPVMEENIPYLSVTFFLTRAYRYNSDKTKIQVIDKFADNYSIKNADGKYINLGVGIRTAWPTVEEAKNHSIVLTSKNGTSYTANISNDYRPMYIGEEDLTNFLIAYLNIPAVRAWNSDKREWYLVSNPEDSECRLDNIEAYFKGDFTELREAVALQPNNVVKILFGVKTTNEGKLRQVAFTKAFLRNSVRDYKNLEDFITFEKGEGRLANIEYPVCELKKYEVTPTAFEELPKQEDDPFGSQPEVDGLPFSFD